MAIDEHCHDVFILYVALIFNNNKLKSVCGQKYAGLATQEF